MNHNDPTRLDIREDSDSGQRSTVPTPTKIGRYRIQKQIGQGGFGIVHLAFDERLNRHVAIKVPHARLVSKQGAAEAYLAEARTVANLEHPNIVPVYDFGTSNEFPCFIVMKYVDGIDLRRRASDSPLGYSQVAELIATVALALHHAHKNGVVHRDLKPENILIDSQDNPYIVDFGLALREQDVGRGARYAGTLTYMSPEQARGEGHRVDGRSDIYGLGAVLYELLVGRKTVSGSTQAEIIEQVKFHEARPPRQIKDSVPRELERICLNALAKRVSERYTTALDLAQDLQHYLASEPATIVASSLQQSSSTLSSMGGNRGDTLVDTAASAHDSVDSQTVSVIPKGLRSFESHDADFFLSLMPGPRDRYGLPESVRFWKGRLEEFNEEQTFNVGLIYGPSGCGKSSMLKAGILPRLSDDVETVFVEATAQNTESDLLRAVPKRWFDAAETRSLSELVTALRRGEGPSVGKKFVLILDQFEQWLHTTSDFEHCELAAALRQCDGGRVQCVLLVRDDFWLQVSRLMRALEVRLIEGHNSAMVDLFDRAHAKRVLAAFGRAYERLPIAKAVTPEQDRFLDLAIASLSEDAKVISVRLALFAEIMKNRTWTPAALESLGGTTGVGVSFLEQTFASPTAPPEYRYHQDAACSVLHALLPEVGVDIKGEMKSYATLMEVSGYENRLEDFEQLIGILDSGVRLIAPTNRTIKRDSDSNAALDSDAKPPSEKYYQLTHDYLVQSLRSWLTRKQQATREGRAELLLSQRTAAWKVANESRLLPAWWEWLSIRAFTRSANWTTSQRQMMHSMDRYLSGRALVLFVFVLLLSGIGWLINGHRRSETLLNMLTRAPTNEVPAVVNEMANYRRWVDPKLRQQLDSPERSLDKRHQLHLRLALLPSDETQVDWLVDQLLRSNPEEALAIRTSLEPHAAQIAPRLWDALQSDQDLDRRLRSASVLARYAPDDDRWTHLNEDVLATLLSESSLLARQWISLLRPVGAKLLPALARLIAESGRGVDLRPMAELYSEFAGESENDFKPLESALQNATPQQQANIATTLAIADRWEAVLPMLTTQPNPTRRSRLIAQLGAHNVGSSRWIERMDWTRQPNASIRHAYALIIGDRPQDLLSKSEHTELPGLLMRWLDSEHDPGVQGAIGWALNRWGVLDQKPLVEKISEMVIVSPTEMEVDGPNGNKRKLAVRRAFAIQRTETTIAQYLNFREGFQWDRRAAASSDCPVHEVRWYDAAAYCNWLSQQAGLPQSQWCYAPNDDGDYASGMIIKHNAIELEGFRLATSDEWELACRAAAFTYWSFGDHVDLLDRYGWSMANSGMHSHPVGRLRPNDLGLFDMHGNVWEWCHDRVDQHGNPITSNGDQSVYDEHHFLLRGGTFMTDPMSLGSATENWNRADKHTNADGFRVVRTILADLNDK